MQRGEGQRRETGYRLIIPVDLPQSMRNRQFHAVSCRSGKGAGREQGWRYIYFTFRILFGFRLFFWGVHAGLVVAGLVVNAGEGVVITRGKVE